MTQQIPELKPCPFCKSKAWRDCSAGGQFNNVCCTRELCGLSNVFMSENEWNTRAEPVIDDRLLAEATYETERVALVKGVGDCCMGGDPFCSGGCLVEKALRKRLTHALKTREKVTNEHRIKVLNEMGFGHEMINDSHIITYDGYKGFFINHTNLMCAMQRIPRAFTVIIHTALKSTKQPR